MSDQNGGVVEATRSYEKWLADRVPVVPSDLVAKHDEMAASAFPFLRATFYRWAQRWPVVAPDAASAPVLVAVGDLHVENFGTWRDAEGRLTWGVNDFDEIARFPYTIDLVRLVTSVLLAAAEGGLDLDAKEAATAVLDGYRAALASGGRALVLAEHDRWLRRLVSSRLRDPVRFWKAIRKLPAASGVPSGLRQSLQRALPGGVEGVSQRSRQAGRGSLGRLRVVAVGTYGGALVAREGKAVAPSAAFWADPDLEEQPQPPPAAPPPGAIRDPDPTIAAGRRWLIRRLSPDCSRVELGSLPARRDEERLLRAMGWETANVHLGTPDAIDAVLRDLATRPRGWLAAAAQAMAGDVVTDWKAWRQASRASSAKPAG